MFICAHIASLQAYDLRDLRVVAAKVHQLNPGWSEARKASYVKHAIREVDIQKVRTHIHSTASNLLFMRLTRRIISICRSWIIMSSG